MIRVKASANRNDLRGRDHVELMYLAGNVSESGFEAEQIWNFGNMIVASTTSVSQSATNPAIWIGRSSDGLESDK